VYGLFSFWDHTYEVIEYCPRTHVYAEPITDERAARQYNNCRNLFYLVLLEKNDEFVLAAESMCVSDCYLLSGVVTAVVWQQLFLVRH